MGELINEESVFDTITVSHLKYYVYMLLNPLDNKPFYIGKGKDNRVFDHKNELIKKHDFLNSDKNKKIQNLLSQGKKIKHLIIRHGLTESESFLIESVLINYLNFFEIELTNLVSGHDSGFYGIKTTDELIRQYNAPKLERIQHDVIIININRRYSNAKSILSIYQATKQAWVINKKRLPKIQYALSEFRGVIVGVFEVNEWYQVLTKDNKRNNRWGFNGVEAPEEIKNLYYNKSIAHTKKRGAANPIRYEL